MAVNLNALHTVQREDERIVNREAMPCRGFTHELARVSRCPILRRIVPNARCIPRRRRSSSSTPRGGVYPGAVRSLMIEAADFSFDIRWPVWSVVGDDCCGSGGVLRQHASGGIENTGGTDIGVILWAPDHCGVFIFSEGLVGELERGRDQRKRHLLHHRTLERETVHATNAKNNAL